MEAQFRRQCAGRDVVGTAKGGEEVVERVLVGEVDGGEMKAPLLLVAVEEVVFADGSVEEATRGNPLRIGVVVALARRGDVDQA